MGFELKVLLAIKTNIRQQSWDEGWSHSIVINHFISNARQRSCLEYSSAKHCISYLKNEVGTKSLTCYKEEYQTSTQS